MNYVEIDKTGAVIIDKTNMAELPVTAGTSLMGQVETTYKTILEAFGEPNGDSDGYKTDVEWTIQTPNGVATIYNWKDGHNYCGEDGLDVWDITDWHIGGHNREVVSWVEKVLAMARESIETIA